VLNGTISATYTTEGDYTSLMVTYDNLGVDDVVINGTRSFSISNAGTVVSIDTVGDFNITLADGSVIEEAGYKLVQYTLGIEPELSLEGSWTIKADGNNYVIDVTSPLKSKSDCDYVDEGVMTVNKNGLEVIVDFGDGTCDSIATVTYPDGTVEEISLDD